MKDKYDALDWDSANPDSQDPEQAQPISEQEASDLIDEFLSVLWDQIEAGETLENVIANERRLVLLEEVIANDRRMAQLTSVDDTSDIDGSRGAYRRLVFDLLVVSLQV